MNKNEYKCDMCGEIFESGWSDEEAKQEAEDIFGKPVDDWKSGQSIVCDDCFKKINPTSPENKDILEKSKKEL